MYGIQQNHGIQQNQSNSHLLKLSDYVIMEKYGPSIQKSGQITQLIEALSYSNHVIFIDWGPYQMLKHPTSIQGYGLFFCFF